MTHVVTQEDVEGRLRALLGRSALTAADASALQQLDRFDIAFAEVGRRGATRAWSARFVTPAIAIAVALVVIVLANTTGAYFAPRYARILADVPGIGPISGRYLQAVGLSGDDVTLVGDSSTSSGHTLKLVAAYADGLRTVLFVSIDGKGLTGDPKQYGPNPGDWAVNFDHISLTDQFGRTYGLWGVGGPTEMQFESLPWPASDLGARLTLHITGLWAMWKGAKLGPNTSIDQESVTVHGDWYLHATLVSQPVHNLALPAPVRSGTGVYSFTSIVASGKTLIIKYTVVGGRDLLPSVYDADGNYMQLEEGGEGETSVFINGPGHYRIEFDGLTTPDQERWIVVP